VPDVSPAVAAQHAQQAQQQANVGIALGKSIPRRIRIHLLRFLQEQWSACPKLKRLTLSYCKHITVGQWHISPSTLLHASSRLTSRVAPQFQTTGFRHWSVYSFPRLTKLCLADCTYLTDHAIVCLTNAAKGLKSWICKLDVSLCFLDAFVYFSLNYKGGSCHKP